MKAKASWLVSTTVWTKPRVFPCLWNAVTLLLVLVVQHLPSFTQERT